MLLYTGWHDGFKSHVQDSRWETTYPAVSQLDAANCIKTKSLLDANNVEHIISVDRSNHTEKSFKLETMGKTDNNLEPSEEVMDRVKRKGC